MPAISDWDEAGSDMAPRYHAPPSSPTPSTVADGQARLRAMTGNIEAAGDLISGALLARAVDGDGTHAGAGGHAALCLNCGTRLIGPHCHRCGQSGHVHRTVGAIGHEIAHGVFHVEGKIWRTLPMLLVRPGLLTRRYIDGERVRFVSPLALFLFTVFLLFATISWVGGDWTANLGGTGNPAARAALDQKMIAAQADLAKEKAARVAAVAARRPTDDIDQRITALAAVARTLETTRNNLWNRDGHFPTSRSVRTGWHRLDEGIAHAQANPGLALYKLQSSAYKYSWLLIPLSTPFVALLFLWRRRFGLYDHAVFVTYSLSFMMVFVAALSIVGGTAMGGDWIALAVLLVPPLHMFVQLRGAYGLGKRSALWRTSLLVGFAFAALLGFTALLLLHGLAE
jgi:hypothetical protein